MRVEPIDLDTWASALPESGVEVFHTPEALSVVDDHWGGTLELLAGYKGERPVGLLPAFVSNRRIGSAILSPPPGMGIPRLGPITMPASPKRRRREQVNREFVSKTLKRLGVGAFGTITRFICPPAYSDPRPFQWEGLTLDPGFTYSIHVEGRSTDDIIGSFSKSLRREVRRAIDHSVTVNEEGPGAGEAVYRSTANRYREQGERYAIEWEYVRDLTKALAETDRCRVYVARDATGEFLSGVTVLYSNDTAYFWQGGAKEAAHDVNVNSLLHWRIIEELIDDPPRPSVARYDLMGANTERLCHYKSKFGGTLHPYFIIESRGPPTVVAKSVYRLMSRR